MPTWIMDPKTHMDHSLSICDIHVNEHDDVMVIFFLQILIDLVYEWYIYLPPHSIGSFDDFENMFMTMYSPPIAYHTLLTHFTQILFKKGEIIRDFNLQFFKTLNQIPKKQQPNESVIFGFYKNVMPAKLNYEIRSSQINDLHGAIQKAT